MALEDLTPVTRTEAILDGDDISPVTRMEYFLGKAANEVPKIAQQFGLDTSVRVNMMSVVHASSTAVNLTRSLAKAK